MALIDNLVSYWKLDEASGARADSKGSNTLAVNGTGGVGSLTGIISNGADFERTDSDFLSITDISQSGLDLNSDCSFSFWTKFEELPSVSGFDFNVISKTDGGTTRAYTIRFNNNVVNGFECEANSDGTTSNSGNGASNANIVGAGDVGTWRHWVATYDLSAHLWKLYKDGSAITTTDNSTGTITQIYQNSVDFRIGARSVSGTPAGFFDGGLDEIGIWSRELTSAEVTELYNGGAGLAYPFTTNNAGFLVFM